jgi:hypothetical protein
VKSRYMNLTPTFTTFTFPSRHSHIALRGLCVYSTLFEPHTLQYASTEIESLLRPDPATFRTCNHTWT